MSENTSFRPANMVLMIRKYGHLVDKSWKAAVSLLDGSGEDHVEKKEAAVPESSADDSRKEESALNDAAAGDPFAKKGGSSEEA